MPATIQVVDGRTVIQAGENTAEAVRQANRAEEAADRSEANAAVANYFTTRALGAAGTATGELFSSDEEGAIGIYRRTGTAPNYLFLEWAGVHPAIGRVPAMPWDEDEDCAPGIYAELRKSHVVHLDLPKRTIKGSHAIAIPSYKSINANHAKFMPLPDFDAFMGATIIGADFTDGGAIPPSEPFNYLTTTGARLMKAHIDVNKLNLGDPDNRINGVVWYLGRDCWGDDLLIENATAYGGLLTGVDNDDEELVQFATGGFRNSLATNCNVGWEAQFAEDFLFSNLGYLGGDADISQEAMFHPQKSRNGTFEDCWGEGPGVGFLLFASSAWASRGIVIDRARILSGGSALTCDNGQLRGVKIGDSDFQSTDNIGAQIINAHVDIINSKFYGKNIGVSSDGNSITRAINSHAEGVSTTGADAYGFTGSSIYDLWDGTATAVAGSGGGRATSGPGQVTRTTIQVPKTYEGGLVQRKTPEGGASNGGVTGITIGAGGDEPWEFDAVAGKRYRMTFGGWCRVTDAAGGSLSMGLIETLGAVATIRGDIDIQQGAGSFAGSALITTADGVADAASRTTATFTDDEYWPFAGEFTFDLTDLGTAVSGRYGIEFASGNVAYSAQLAGGDWFKVEAG